MECAHVDSISCSALGIHGRPDDPENEQDVDEQGSRKRLKTSDRRPAEPGGKTQPKEGHRDSTKPVDQAIPKQVLGTRQRSVDSPDGQQSDDQRPNTRPKVNPQPDDVPEVDGVRNNSSPVATPAHPPSEEYHDSSCRPPQFHGCQNSPTSAEAS